MNSRLLSKSVQLFALSLLIIPLSAFAKQKAATFSAEFTGDGDKCVMGEVVVHAVTSGNSKNAKVSFSMYRENICNDDEPPLIVQAVDAKLKKGGLSIDDELKVASLNGTITVVEKSPKKRYEVTLNLSWNGDEDLILADTRRDITKRPSDEESLSKTKKFRSAYRDALAGGTIGVNGYQVNLDATGEATLVSTHVK